jgi:hypothetical protein
VYSLPFLPGISQAFTSLQDNGEHRDGASSGTSKSEKLAVHSMPLLDNPFAPIKPGMLSDAIDINFEMTFEVDSTSDEAQKWIDFPFSVSTSPQCNDSDVIFAKLLSCGVTSFAISEICTADTEISAFKQLRYAVAEEIPTALNAFLFSSADIEKSKPPTPAAINVAIATRKYGCETAFLRISMFLSFLFGIGRSGFLLQLGNESLGTWKLSKKVFEVLTSVQVQAFSSELG